MTDDDLTKTLIEPVEEVVRHLEEAVKRFGDPHTATRDMAVPVCGFYIHPFHYQSIKEELAVDIYGEVYGHWYMEALNKIDLEEALLNA